MAKTVEIPDELHDELAARAEKEGVSVSEVVSRELQKVTGGISSEELFERLKRLPKVDLGDLTAADIIREGREERTARIIDAITRR